MMNPMGATRQPAVAGSFYPANPGELRAQVEHLLSEASAAQLSPKALIAPHAGYVYSGPIAASAYRTLVPFITRIRRVVLLGPSHFVPFHGLALPDAEAFETPLGRVELDRAALTMLDGNPAVRVLDAAHEREHSLEVQLPFLQVVLDTFTLVPLAVGHAEPEQVAAVLDLLWGDEETLIVISSDLSHYRSYEAAAVIDAETAKAIERLDEEPLDGDHACGCHPIRGLLHAARRRGMRVVPLDRRTSGDTAGDKRRVVGYGAWAFV